MLLIPGVDTAMCFLPLIVKKGKLTVVTCGWRVKSFATNGVTVGGHPLTGHVPLVTTTGGRLVVNFSTRFDELPSRE